MYQVRSGSLIVIAIHAIDAIDLFDRFQEKGEGTVEVSRNGRKVDVDNLRASRVVDIGARRPPATSACG